MLAFWLSVELLKDEEARAMVSIDPLVEQIVINLRDNGIVYQKHLRNVFLRKQQRQNFRRNAMNDDEEDEEQPL